MEKWRKYWFYIEHFQILAKKSVKIGKIVSRLAVNSLIKDQISQKPRIITNKDIYVLYHWVLCFQKMYATIGNNVWPRKKINLKKGFSNKFT